MQQILFVYSSASFLWHFIMRAIFWRQFLVSEDAFAIVLVNLLECASIAEKKIYPSSASFSCIKQKYDISKQINHTRDRKLSPKQISLTRACLITYKCGSGTLEIRFLPINELLTAEMRGRLCTSDPKFKVRSTLATFLLLLLTHDSIENYLRKRKKKENIYKWLLYKNKEINATLFWLFLRRSKAHSRANSESASSAFCSVCLSVCSIFPEYCSPSALLLTFLTYW